MDPLQARDDKLEVADQARSLVGHQIAQLANEERSPPKFRSLERVSIDSGPLERLIQGSKTLIDDLQNEKEEKVAENEFWDEDRERILSQVKAEGAKASEGGEKESKSWWGKWVDSIKYSFVTKETEEAFLEVVLILKAFFQDVNVKGIDILMGLILLNTYNKEFSEAVRTELRVLDVDLITTFFHYTKFASAAYGWKLLYGYQFKKSTKGILQGFTKSDSINKTVLIEHTGIKEDDIISMNWKSDNFHPGHYIALDHSRKSLVVSIRGTFHAKDALVDLIARYEPFMGGYAHSGILLAAKQKYRDLMPMILDTLKKYPDYELVLVGHSLGAGTAALLTVLIYNEYSIPLHCYAFASPCVMSLDVAHKCKHFITTIVVGDDIIPRLSYGALEDLKQVILHLLSQTNNNAQRFFQMLSAGNNLGDAMTNKIANYLSCNPIPDLGRDKVIPSAKLFPPGSVYHIIDEKNRKRNAKYDLLETSDASLFGEIIVSYNMFIDHMPGVYELALEGVITRIFDESLKKAEQEMVSKESLATDI